MNESAPQGEPIPSEWPWKDAAGRRFIPRPVAATQAAPSVAARDLQHIEHVEYWADAYKNPAKDDDQFIGHPIAGKLLTEYAALLRSLAALPLPAVVQAEPEQPEYLRPHCGECGRSFYQAAPSSTQPAAHQLDTQRATEGMPAPVEPELGDTVRHIPSGEEWLVAYVRDGKLAACGWPFELVPLSDCELVSRMPLGKKLDLLREVSRGDDSRGEHARALLRSACLIVEAKTTASPVVHPAGERTASSEGQREAHAGYRAVPDGTDGASQLPARAEMERLKTENSDLRTYLCDVLKALGNGSGASVECSMQFLSFIPDEVRSEVATLRASPPVQQGVVEALEKDAARLDWLQAHENVLAVCFAQSEWKLFNAGGPLGAASGLRGAIDAAIATQAVEKP